MATEKKRFGWGIRTIGVIAWSLSALSACSAVLAIIRVWGIPGVEAPVTVSPFLPGGPNPERGGGFTSGVLYVETLPVATRIWLTVAVLAGVGLFIGIALTLSTLVASVRDGEGFTRRLARTLYVLAGGVIVLGLLLSVSEQMAALTLGQALFPPDTGDMSVPQASTGFRFEGWPLWAAAGIAALGFVFDRAARLQRDAAGMV